MAQQTADLAIAAARLVATEVVRERFPDLADVEPQVSVSKACSPTPGDARRLGVADAGARPAAAPQYTFTFTSEVRTPEGYTLPRIARVTVDAGQRVVKAVVSK